MQSFLVSGVNMSLTNSKCAWKHSTHLIFYRGGISPSITKRGVVQKKWKGDDDNVMPNCVCFAWYDMVLRFEAVKHSRKEMVMKKILSIFLALMLVCSFSVNIFAEPAVTNQNFDESVFKNIGKDEVKKFRVNHKFCGIRDFWHSPCG